MSTFHLIVLLIVTHAIAFAAGWLAERNNPNLKGVNKLIETGDAFIDATGKLIKKK